jgi:undecaprenyl-diphosphatase
LPSGSSISFNCAWIVVKTFLGYVARHGFSLFVWWRLVVGAAGLLVLARGA